MTKKNINSVPKKQFSRTAPLHSFPPDKGGNPRKKKFVNSHDARTAQRVSRRTTHATTTGSWGSVAEWYTKHLESPDTYHARVVLPNLLRLLNPKPTERILDIACGEGFFARAIKARGANIEGVDVGPELIAIARRKSPEIPFYVAPAEDLSAFPSNTYDQAIIVLAIQNIEHADRALAEGARILRNGGSLHLVMNHPAFRIPRHSGWTYDKNGQVQLRWVDRYLSEFRTEVEMHPGILGSPKTLSFHRPLQYYFKMLTKAGLIVDRLEEWISHRTSNSGPRATAENVARKEIPLFLYLRARKIG